MSLQSLSEKKPIDTTRRWGIDLERRRMLFDPWPLDGELAYRAPDEREREEVYGVSGEALRETLLYLEQCGGSTERLVRLLNDHAPGERFYVRREDLLDASRWYTNEYYFYFVMFAKKTMGDYDWRYTTGEGVQLSVHHKIYEIGFLRYPPYGMNIMEDTNSLFYGAVKYYSSLGTDMNDYFDWLEALVIPTGSVSYKHEVSKMENYWIGSEFNIFLQEMLKIILNINALSLVSGRVMEHHDFIGFSYVPESMLPKILGFVFEKSTKCYELSVDFEAGRNSVGLSMRFKDDCDFGKFHEYRASVCYNSNNIVLGAFPKIVARLLKTTETPRVTDVAELDSERFAFTIRWKRKIGPVPVPALLAANLALVTACVIDSVLGPGSPVLMALLCFVTNFAVFIARRLEIEKQRREVLDDHLIKVNEDNSRRLEKAEELWRELMLEKEALEEKVNKRTLELATANERLKELDVAKTNFFANVSHELRTPITLVLGPLEAIIRGEYGPVIASDDQKLAIMRENASRLLALINNLLDFTRIEAGRMTLRAERTDVAGLLRHYVSIVKTYADGKGLSVVFNDNTPPSMKDRSGTVAWMDRELFERVIFNLLSNALKFTDPGGDIIIQLDPGEDRFTVSVKDTGIGIPDDKLDVIFERFTQVDGSVSRKYGGTGIGLSLAREIVGIMGGEIGVRSRLKAGSVFSVTLPYGSEKPEEPGYRPEPEVIKPQLLAGISPVNAKKPAAVENASGAAGANGRPKILVVEDSGDMRIFLGSILGSEYSVVTANNGMEGLAACEREAPDLILADVMMPCMDGYEMTRRVKADERLAGIPVLLLTAKADAFMKLDGFGHGADDYVVKPFDSMELRARIKAHIGTKKLRDRVVRQLADLAEKNACLERIMEERRLAAERLEESERRFREMAELLPSAIVEFDESYRITYTNRAGFSLFGFTESEMAAGILVTDFFETGDRERFVANAGEAAASGGDRLYEYAFRSGSGKGFIGLFKSVPLYSGNRACGARAIITEVRTRLDLALLPDDRFLDRYVLSGREKEVLLLALKGYGNKEIGEKLFISDRTVKKHMASIFQKTDTSTRRELTRLVRESRGNA